MSRETGYGFCAPLRHGAPRCANKNDFINHYHKNNKHTLVTLCKEHHQNVHKGCIIINGWKQINKEFILDYTENIITKKKKKYNTNQLILINSIK